jgi:CheY-like chemotaxis protein
VKGAKVTVSGTGQSSIDYFGGKTEPVDAVILDLVMSALDAKTTFRTLRKIEEDLQACIASGYSVDGDALRLPDEGACSFVVQKLFLIYELPVPFPDVSP